MKPLDLEARVGIEPRSLPRTTQLRISGGTSQEVRSNYAFRSIPLECYAQFCAHPSRQGFACWPEPFPACSLHTWKMPHGCSGLEPDRTPRSELWKNNYVLGQHE